MSVRIILADDRDAIRKAQRGILEAEPDFEIIGEACNGQELIQLVEQSPPDLVITDINMPIINGLEATRRLDHSYPDVKVIGFSSHETQACVLGMLQAGASGYVVKPSSVSELRKAIRVVLKGEFYLSPSLHGILIDEILRMHKKKYSI